MFLAICPEGHTTILHTPRHINHYWYGLDSDDKSCLSLYNFKFYFTLLSKSFSPFPHGTCSLSVSHFIFSLGRTLSPSFILQYQTVLLGKYNSFSSTRANTGLSPSLVSQGIMLFEHRFISC